MKEEMKEKCNCTTECTCGDDCHCTEEQNCGCGGHCQEEKPNKKEKKKKSKENEELEIAKKTILELQSKLMYQQAENINYRKRKDEETANLLKYANGDLLLDLVNMVENLDRAASIKAESEESKKIQAGIKMVSNQFKDILTKYGVVEIEALGYPFDPDYMEAMMIENNPEKPNDMVLEVLVTGYKYKDRILKHSVVKVNQVENTEEENKKGNDSNE